MRALFHLGDEEAPKYRGRAQGVRFRWVVPTLRRLDSGALTTKRARWLQQAAGRVKALAYCRRMQEGRPDGSCYAQQASEVLLKLQRAVTLGSAEEHRSHLGTTSTNPAGNEAER